MFKDKSDLDQDLNPGLGGAVGSTSTCSAVDLGSNSGQGKHFFI